MCRHVAVRPLRPKEGVAYRLGGPRVFTGAVLRAALVVVNARFRATRGSRRRRERHVRRTQVARTAVGVL